MNNPKVSVCMSIYNTEEKYLREAISSILNQSFSDFEFLIVNDSPQNTKLTEIVNSFKDKRIKYTVNSQNLGISGARNRLLAQAKGEYIAVMDHDDVSQPDRLEKQVKFLDLHPEIGVIGSYYRRIPDGKIKKLPENDFDIKCSLFTRCSLLHPSTMIRKSILDENSIRYEDEFTPAEDYALWCRLVPLTHFANLPDILFHYRKHQRNTSKSQKEAMKKNSAKILSFYRENNEALWLTAQKNIKTIYRLKFLSFFTVLSVSQYRNEQTYKLLGFIPLFRCRKTSSKALLSFLATIPGFKIAAKSRYIPE